MFPENLVNEWHPTKNVEPLTSFSFSSRKDGFWVCSKGHEWKARIAHRTNGSGCPFCAGRKVFSGFNDALTVNPEIANQWHPIKNGSLSPSEVTAGSHRKVWWLCNCGHEWEAPIRNRIVKKYGCPACAGKYVAEQNDLYTKNPKLAALWHPTKNGKLSPSDVNATSHRKVWWLCNEGHETFTSVANRTAGYTCGMCANRPQRIISHPMLSISHPGLFKELHPSLNLEKNNITSGSGIAWWICVEGHEWEATVYDRAIKQRGCPYCAGRLAIPNVSDFSTTVPHLLEEFDKEKNYNVDIAKIKAFSNIPLWWKCTKGHSWKTLVSVRSRGSNCPYCSNQTSSGEKNLGAFIEEELQQKVIFRSKSIIAPFELDIYLPEKNFAVEFNGLYWHSEANGRNKYYHYDKWKVCKDLGIQLVHVWEDDWNRNPDLVKRMIAHKLGVSGERKVYARNTFVRELSHSVSDAFLNEFHVQGSPIKGSVVVGLFENITPLDTETKSELVGVMVLKKEPGEENVLNLLRFATSVSVVGGFTKFLKYVEKNYVPSRIVTFSDNAVSDGGLYENNGFVAVKDLKPDYIYVVKGERVHKFSYRLKRFREDPELEFFDGLSERELALLNGLPRIWDAGKTKWVKVF